METGYEIEQGTLRIHVPEELDHHVAEKIRNETGIMMEQRMIHTILFDFERTTFMDSSGIGVVLGRVKQMRLVGGVVEVCNMREQIRKILSMAGVLEVVSLWEEKV